MRPFFSPSFWSQVFRKGDRRRATPLFVLQLPFHAISDTGASPFPTLSFGFPGDKYNLYDLYLEWSDPPCPLKQRALVLGNCALVLLASSPFLCAGFRPPVMLPFIFFGTVVALWERSGPLKPPLSRERAGVPPFPPPFLQFFYSGPFAICSAIPLLQLAASRPPSDLGNQNPRR